MADYILRWSSTQIVTGLFDPGTQYIITTSGNTDFTSFGSVNNNVGTTFIANNNTITPTSLIIGKAYKILTLGSTVFSTVGALLTNAGNFISGNTYIISTVGTTNFTLIGASSNTVGTIFTASFVGTDPTAGTTGSAFGQQFVASAVGTGTGTVTGNCGSGTATTAFKPSLTVSETAIDSTSTSLSLSGRGSVDWGRLIQENMLRVTENFADKIEPLAPTIGQTWYNSLGGNLNLYSQNSVAAGSFVIGQTYTISSVGTTDFTLIGAVGNSIGMTFVATGVGSGTGTAMSSSPTWKEVPTVNHASLVAALMFPKPEWPVFPCYEVGAETTRIVNGSTIETFVFNGVNLSYGEMTDTRCTSVGALAATDDADARFGYVFKVGSIYYQTYQRAADGQIGLKKSINKLNWTVINGGNPVLSGGAIGSIYYHTWNTGVYVSGDTWHLWVECGAAGDQSDVGIAYSYGTFSGDVINFDTHRTASHVIRGGGQPNPVLIDNYLVMLHGSINVQDRTLWEIRAATVLVTSNWALPESYTESPYFQVKYQGMHTADPDFVDFGTTKSHRLGIGFMYNQNRSDLLYLDMTPAQFLDALLNGYRGGFGRYPKFSETLSLACGSGSVTMNTGFSYFYWQIVGNVLEFQFSFVVGTTSIPGGRLSVTLPFSIFPTKPMSGVCHAYNIVGVLGVYEYEISGSTMYIDRFEAGVQNLDAAAQLVPDSTLKGFGIIIF